MKKPTPILILSLLFLIVGCSTDIESLQERNNLYYEVNSDKPFSGSILSKYESGQKKIKGYLKDGVRVGQFKEWYDNGQLKSEVFINEYGRPEGLVSNYFKNGQKMLEMSYKDGEQVGSEIMWYESGQKQFERYFRDGKLHGISTSWFENGQKNSEGKIFGKKDGEWNYWSPSGSKTTMVYKDGKEWNGEESRWYENGIRKSKVVYINGGKIISQMWNEKGNRIY